MPLSLSKAAVVFRDAVAIVDWTVNPA